MPPLRDRREDIEPLTWAFVNEFADKMGKPIDKIASKGLEALQRYPWPGNVRELRNVIERSMIQARGRTLQIHVPTRSPGSAGELGPLRDVEFEHIVKVLERTGWETKAVRAAPSRISVGPPAERGSR